MNFHIDRSRPHIDGSTIRCRYCGQTYDAIVDGFTSLPPHHYPQPTRLIGGPRSGTVTVGVETTGGYPGRFCPADGDTLSRNLLEAQVAAEQLEQRRGAA